MLFDMPNKHHRLFNFAFIFALLTTPLVASTQACEKVKLTDFPKSDLPAVLDTSVSKQSNLKTQASYKFYYGIGVSIDYIKARRLAFNEFALETEDSDPFSGSSILVMLYANGFGVKRDLDLSIRLACGNIGAADAEIEGRVEHLKRMKAGRLTDTFDICDDITSGYMMGWCASVHAELDSINRQQVIHSVIKGWTESEKLAYSSLRKTASDFFKTRVTSEVDLSGTARAAEEIGEEQSLENTFKDQIVMIAKCGFKAYTPQQFEAADKILNKVYEQIMKVEHPGWGTVTRERIRSTQREWIKYRDAWVKFVAVKCPGITESSVMTMLSNERVIELQDLIGSL